jgi:flagellar basal body-associated protein FliL
MEYKMTTKRKRIIWLLALTPVVILLLLGGGYWYLYQRGVSADTPITAIGSVKLTPKDNARLGETVVAALKLKCPWHRRPVEAQALAGKGSRIVAQPAFKKISRGFGSDLWLVSVKLKPYRTGAIPDGKLNIQFNRYDNKTKMLNLSEVIPSFVVEPLKLKPTDKPALAGEVEEILPPSRTRLYIIIGAILVAIVLVAAVIISKLARGGDFSKLTPWDIAFMQLDRIRHNISDGNANLEDCFVSLTDVVRNYLEQRFHLNAPTQTTDEFLEDLRDSESLPEEEHRRFLKEFMTSADLVKFAKLPPSESDLLHTVSKAETLINETKPVEEEVKEK